MRHPADLRTQVAPAGDEGGFPARIRDLSRGGLKLLADRPFDPGDLVTVGLPDANGAPNLTVLACVVHCQALGPKQWAVGCNFSQELSEAELRAFGAARARPTPPDLRAWERSPCDVRAVCQTVSGAEPPWAAQVLNVSPAGMALAVEREVSNGALLSAVLHGPHGGEPLTILACVVHVSERAGGGRMLGCNFIRELSEDDLRRLL